MKKESFYDPKERIMNPYNLYMKHALARGSWDTRGMIFYIAAVACPIVFAFTINPIQLLKLCYLPLSILISGMLFNMPSVTLTSKVFWLIQPVLLSLPIVVIQASIPDPFWFALVPFLQIWLFWRTMRVLPNSESLDWRRFTARTGLSIETCHEIIAQERQKTNCRQTLGSAASNAKNRGMKSKYLSLEEEIYKDLKHEPSIEEIVLASKAACLTDKEVKEIQAYAETKAKEMETFLESATPEEIAKRLREHSKEIRSGTNIGDLDWGLHGDE